MPHAPFEGFAELGDDAPLDPQQARDVRSQARKARQERAGASGVDQRAVPTLPAHSGLPRPADRR